MDAANQLDHRELQCKHWDRRASPPKVAQDRARSKMKRRLQEVEALHSPEEPYTSSKLLSNRTVDFD